MPGEQKHYIQKNLAPQSAYLQIFADNNYDNGLSVIYIFTIPIWMPIAPLS